MTTKHTIKIGFIGFGSMAEAIWINGSSTGLLSTETTRFCEENSDRESDISSRYGLKSASVQDLVDSCDMILFCVKPQHIKTLLDSISDLSFDKKCVVSILAGTGTDTFRNYLGDTVQCIRIMPNTPLMIGHGMTAISALETVEDRYLDVVRTLFEAAGDVKLVPESLLDTITALSGSGPAFFYRIVEAFAQEAVQQGMTYDDAVAFVSQTLIGAGHMIQESGKTCDELIAQVKSPGGTTAAGLEVFDQTSLDDHLKTVIRQSIKQAKALAKG